MRNALILSAALHIAILIIAWIGLPVFFKPLPPPPVIIPVEITDIGAITNTRIKEQQEKKPPQPEEKPVTKPAPTPPQPEKPQEIVKKELKPVETPDEEKPEAIPDKKKPEKPKKQEDKPKPKQDQLASVLKNISKLQQTTPNDQEKPKTKDDSAPEPVSNAPSLSDRLTISEEDALRRQIARCWNMPVGAREAEKLIVEVLIEVNPDRTVQRAEIVETSRMSDPFYRAAAEAALRALRNPRCSPLELPPDKYDQWKSIRFNFDPRDML